jgi:hypothetical protein
MSGPRARIINKQKTWICDECQKMFESYTFLREHQIVTSHRGVLEVEIDL